VPLPWWRILDVAVKLLIYGVHVHLERKSRRRAQRILQRSLPSGVRLPWIAVVLRRAEWRRANRAGGARRRLWQRAAQTAGLHHVEERDDGKFTGRMGVYRVRFEAWESPDGRGAGTRIVISGLRHGPSGTGLTLRLEEPGSKSPDPREIEIGDEEFDQVVSVRGSPALARAALDADTRRAVAGLVGGNLPVPGRPPLQIAGELEDGELCILVPQVTFDWIGDSDDRTVKLTGVIFEPEGRLPEVLRVALALASRLDEPQDRAKAIAESTARELNSRVRRSNLVALERELPESQHTLEALLAAGSDPDADVRLQAGILLGERGRERLDDHLVRQSVDVLRGITSVEGAADETRARAVATLGTGLKVEEAQSILREALRTQRTATAVACLGVLGARGGAEAIPAIAGVLTEEKHELAAAAAEALGRTGDPSAEEPLLRALLDGAPPVRVAAARALGRVGTATAVPALLEAESSGGEMRRVARQAVAEIQARLAEAAGAAPGQLSLAGGEAGQVSLVEEDGAGRLTLAGPAQVRRDVSAEGTLRPQRTGVEEAIVEEGSSASGPQVRRRSRTSE